MFKKLPATAALAAGMVLGVGATLALSTWAAPSRPALPWQQANLFAEVYERVRDEYIEDLPPETLMEHAVRGMVTALDQHSSYLNAQEYAEFRSVTSGDYSGVGIEVSRAGGQLEIVAVVAGSPAERAGMSGGDVITNVDTIEVNESTLRAAVDRIRGRPGSHVTLTVRRTGETEPLRFELVRRKVHVQSVQATLLEPGYGYLRISQFNEATAEDFAAALTELQRSAPLQGAVLDLRNNPGGVLEAAAQVADDFLDDGVIVSAEGRAREANFALHAHPGDMLRGAPIVVLVNGGSASAAEILAGALQDHGRATIAGRTTYGKASVQTIKPLEQGGALKITTARYRTPSGAYIEQRGIVPSRVLPEAPAPAQTGAVNAADGDGDVRVALQMLKTK